MMFAMICDHECAHVHALEGGSQSQQREKKREGEGERDRV